MALARSIQTNKSAVGLHISQYQLNLAEVKLFAWSSKGAEHTQNDLHHHQLWSNDDLALYRLFNNSYADICSKR